MGLIESIVSAPDRRGSEDAFDLGGDYRACEPDLSFPWPDEGAPAEAYAEAAEPYASAASEHFLVASQNGSSPRGEPLFGRPFRSSDDNLALSEDGYLLNGRGQFVLGLPLDGEGRRVGEQPEILRINADSVAPTPSDCVVYRVNLPSFPLTANAEFDVADSELLDKTQFARDLSAQGSGIVLGEDRVKFLARSLAGGSVTVLAREGVKVQLALRWAKIGSLRTAGCDWWNLFYRVRRDPRAGEVAWKNSGHGFIFEADGRLSTTAHSMPVFDVSVDGYRLGNLSLILGPAGITQYADRSGLVKVLEMTANGSAGGAFAGISMSPRGRLFAHYADGLTRPVADVHFPEEENWADGAGETRETERARRVA
jgi:flagellar hook protein FlgE